MRRPLTAAVLFLALGAADGARAQAPATPPLPATPHLPSFGAGLFGHRAAQTAYAPEREAAPTLFRQPAGTLAGRQATLQALQDCYAREASKVKSSGGADSRVSRLRQLCENEELADTRAWLKWSKIGVGRSTQHILNALQKDAAEKALNGDAPPTQ